jgi:hypothetical protein
MPVHDWARVGDGTFHDFHELPRERRLTAVAYVGGAVVECFVAHFAAGEPVPPMPLFLTRENYVEVPLEAAYRAAWEDVPPRYQEVLLAPPGSPSGANGS